MRKLIVSSLVSLDGIHGDPQSRIGWPPVVERLGDEALGLIRGVLWCHDRAGADDRLCHFAEEFELAISEGVMHQGAVLLDRPARHAY